MASNNVNDLVTTRTVQSVPLHQPETLHRTKDAEDSERKDWREESLHLSILGRLHPTAIFHKEYDRA